MRGIHDGYAGRVLGDGIPNGMGVEGIMGHGVDIRLKLPGNVAAWARPDFIDRVSGSREHLHSTKGLRCTPTGG